MRAKAAQGELVGQLGELEREGQVGVDGATLSRGVRAPGGPLGNALAMRRDLGCLSVLAVVALAACGSGSSGKQSTKSRTSTSTSSSTSIISASSTAASSATTRPSTSSTTRGATVTTVPSGSCGERAAAIVAAIEGSDVGGLNTQRGNFTVQRCRIAASNPIWAAADTVPNPGAPLDGAIVVLQRVGALWTVMDVGTAEVGCTAPASVQHDLSLECP